MKLRLNTTEFLDWAECWCFRCEHDHEFSHGAENDTGGCPLLVTQACGDDVAEFEARDVKWWGYIPALVSCSRFTLCTRCEPEPPDAERRGGETRREFHDRLRAEILARPVVADTGA